MKIYTKTGDSGETGLFGGARLPKSHLRIEGYGTVDELNAYLGLVRDLLNKDWEASAFLTRIQDRLFVMGSMLATEPGKRNVSTPLLVESDVEELEQSIDRMDAVLAPMRNFILPGGHVWVSHIHVARTICRRAERRVVALHTIEAVNDLILRYLNRLSDYLFTLSRWVAQETKSEEIPWIPQNYK
jgi:cob(I)alamin adenosyltransferase